MPGGKAIYTFPSQQYVTKRIVPKTCEDFHNPRGIWILLDPISELLVDLFGVRRGVIEESASDVFGHSDIQTTLSNIGKSKLELRSTGLHTAM